MVYADVVKSCDETNAQNECTKEKQEALAQALCKYWDELSVDATEGNECLAELTERISWAKSVIRRGIPFFSTEKCNSWSLIFFNSHFTNNITSLKLVYLLILYNVINFLLINKRLLIFK
ncbi:hypothetical protein SH2C18_03400 [Clostridium sediminicola]|uniref:hypothetical protein n=1 Tax=Clostridium sediminicola TaxID=3114879 RepID=UPI0031F22937